MIRSILLLTLLTFSTSYLSAQTQSPLMSSALSIQPKNQSTNVAGADAQCLSVYVEGNTKQVLKAWKAFLKDRYALKLKKEGLWLKGAEANLSDVWPKNTTIVYTKALASGTGTNLETAIDLGGKYLNANDHSVQYTTFEAQVKTFVREFYSDNLNAVLKKETKAQTKQNKALAGLNKTKAKQEKTIAKAKASIQKANKKIQKEKAKIAKSESAVEALNGEVEKQETLSKSTLEKKKTTVREITAQQKEVGAQNEQVQKILDQLELIKGL